MSTITIHRVNTIAALQSLDSTYGVEIDIRHNPATGRLYLNHDPGQGADLEEYLRIVSEKKLPLVICNIKEAGFESTVIDFAIKYGIKDWFLLDVEFPFIYKSAYGTVPNLDGRVAVRYSEAEPIEQALLLAGHAKWVWVDVNSRLPLVPESHQRLRDAGYKLALVCPTRWNRPDDVERYIAYMKEAKITVDTVMTDEAHARAWAQSGVVV